MLSLGFHSCETTSSVTVFNTLFSSTIVVYCAGGVAVGCLIVGNIVLT
jgi:hypothetical protein